MKKFNELVSPTGAVLSIIAEIAPEVIEHIPEKKIAKIEKRVLQNITTLQLKEMENTLLAGDGVDFPKICGVFTSESTVRKTKKGAAKRKVSVCTRVSMNRKYNDK